MGTLFISDLHLHESRPAITAAFFAFLKRKAASAEALYILGDFFDSWIGDDEDSEFSQQVIAELKALSDSGVKLFFMHGNRDFLVGNEFCRASGATLLADPSVIDLYGEQILLMHGDSLCTRDRDYMQFRAQARSHEWQQQILAMPLAQRRALAAQLREQSQSLNAMKAEDIMDVTPDEVAAVMSRAEVSRLIHGHTHRPARHQFNLNGDTAERIVLGDWCQSLWYIEADERGLELIEEPLAE